MGSGGRATGNTRRHEFAMVEPGATRNRRGVVDPGNEQAGNPAQAQKHAHITRAAEVAGRQSWEHTRPPSRQSSAQCIPLQIQDSSSTEIDSKLLLHICATYA